MITWILDSLVLVADVLREVGGQRGSVLALNYDKIVIIICPCPMLLRINHKHDIFLPAHLPKFHCIRVKSVDFYADSIPALKITDPVVILHLKLERHKIHIIF